MDAPVPPTIRGEFLYRDALFVDVGGEGKRHTRASPSELKDLLNGKAPKDQVGHWYEAQLIHYGLPRSKQKDTAKVRLQQAMGKGKFVVPPHLLEMEAQMRKEYAGALRKAKAGSKGGDGAVVAKKRKADIEEESGSSKKTKISMNVGDFSINIEHASQSSAKKAGATEKQAGAKKTTVKKATPARPKNVDPDHEPMKATKPKVTKAPSTTTPATIIAERSADKNKQKAVQPDQTSTPKAKPGPKPKKDPNAKVASNPVAKSDVKQKSEPKAKSEPNVKAEPKIKSEPKVKPEPKIKSEPKVKQEPKVKKEPSNNKSTPVKREPTIKPEPDDADPMDIDAPPQDQSDITLVTGVYYIDSPQLAAQYPDLINDFRLFLCVDDGKLWGGFELGPKSGVLCSDAIKINDSMTFGWRARDHWDGGQLAFGRGCNGDMTLYGREQVTGTLYNMFPEPVTFEGKRRPGPLWCGRSAYAFEGEWKGFVSEAYGR